MLRSRVLEVFTDPWPTFYFTLGRGKPSRPVEQLYFTHRGEIIGSFKITMIVRSEGQLPKLCSITNRESEWQIKPDNYVAICDPPFAPLEDRVYHPGFRGWHYFDLCRYRETLDAKVRI